MLCIPNCIAENFLGVTEVCLLPMQMGIKTLLNNELYRLLEGVAYPLLIGFKAFYPQLQVHPQ